MTFCQIRVFLLVVRAIGRGYRIMFMKGMSGSARSVQTFLIPMVVAVALFMQIFDATVVTMALPAMAKTMGESPIYLSLAITSYLLSLAMFLPVSGWMADRFGARTVFVSAIMVFVVGSVGCAFAKDLPMLVGARLVQGMGGAMMVPVARYIMLRSVSKENLVQAMAWFTMPALLGPVMGPPVGGFIVTYLDWPWVFWINVPIGFIGIVLVFLYVPNLRQARSRPLDGIGLILTGLALAGMIVGLETFGRDIVSLQVGVACFLGGVCAAILYALHARRVKFPALDFSVMRHPTYRVSLIGGTVFRLGVGGTGFIVALQLQTTFGMTAFKAGLISFSMAVGAFLMKALAGSILKRWGFRSTLVVNSVLASIALAGPLFFHAMTPAVVMFGVLFLGGLTRSLQFTALNTVGFVDVPDTLIGPANTLYSMGQEFSFVLGVTLASSLMHMASSFHGGLSEASYLMIYLPLAVLTGVSAFFFLPMSPQAGAASSGHHRQR